MLYPWKYGIRIEGLRHMNQRSRSKNSMECIEIRNHNLCFIKGNNICYSEIEVLDQNISKILLLSVKDQG